MTTTTTTIVKPWYRQFYLRRGDAEWASDRISDRGCERQLEAVGGFAYVGTTMYGSPTSVVFEVHTDAPEPLQSSADRVVEVSIGGLAILNWGDNAPIESIDTLEGALRLRVSWFDLGAAEVHPDYERGGVERSPEQLLIQLWPRAHVGASRAARAASSRLAADRTQPLGTLTSPGVTRSLCRDEFAYALQSAGIMRARRLG